LSRGWHWQVELVFNPETVLAETTAVAATINAQGTRGRARHRRIWELDMAGF